MYPNALRSKFGIGYFEELTHQSRPPQKSVWGCRELVGCGMSWGVKTTCFKAPGVSLGGSGVSIGGVRSIRVGSFCFWGFGKNVDLMVRFLRFWMLWMRINISKVEI